MDDITSNINITCDMLITIIRNLIVLSNTSSNISPNALSYLLQEATSSPTSTVMPYSSFDNISQYQYHLYHPLYSNNKLNRYQTRSTDSPSKPTSTDTSNSNQLNEK